MANSTVDGSVVINVDMDVSDAQKELARLKTKIIRLEDDLGEKVFKRSGINSELIQARKELQKLKAEKPAALVDGNWIDNTEYYEKLSAAEKTVSELSQQIKKIDEEIDAGNLTLEYTKMRYGEILPLAENLRKEEEARAAAEKQAKEEANQAGEEAKRAERQSREEEKRQAQIAKEAQAAIEAQTAQQRLLDIKENAAVADQRLVDLQDELLKLAQRRAELESAGIGLGYQEYDEIAKRTTAINAELREYQDNLIGAKSRTEDLGKSTDAVQKSMRRLGGRIMELVKSAFIFNVISKALTSLQQLTMKYIKTNDGARQAIAQLKGALLTLAQPLIEVVIPVFTMLVNILTRVITVIAQLVSALFGKTIKQSKDGAAAMYKEANAIGAVGKAADEAAGSLAGFDEINTISTENANGGSGGGGAAGGEIAPDFSTGWLDDNLLNRIKEIADLVALIGAGFALWKIGDMLPGVLGQIATLLGGILITVGGLLLFWRGLTDAWENGVDWLNLIEMIGGLAAAAFGLYTVFEMLHPGFGKIAAGIALVIGGITMLVTGFHDAFEHGWNLQNLLLSMAGLFAAGLGISLLTNSWIPALIGGILAILLAITVATGHGEELLNGIRTVMEGFMDFFTGIFTGDFDLAVQGLIKIFSGLKTTVTAVLDGIRDFIGLFLDWLDEKTNGKFHGIIETVRGIVNGVFDGIKMVLNGFTTFLSGVFTGNLGQAIAGIGVIIEGLRTIVYAIIDGIQNSIIGFLNWLDEKTGGKFHGIIETAKGFVTGFFDSVKTTLGGILDSVKQIFTGVIQFISGVFTNDWDLAWEGVKNIFKGVWNGVVSLLEGAVNLIVKGVNALISGLNKLHIDIPDNPFTGPMRLGFNIPSIPEAKIPRLAQGAVIPPNREFMAVLGDQRNGTNLEAPENLIRKIVREESGGGNTALLEAILNAIKAGHVIMVDRRVLGQVVTREQNRMTRQQGRSVSLG